MNVLVLFSGGIDSSSIICYYKKNNFDIKALWIDYGQDSRTEEVKAAQKLTKYFNIPLTIINTNIKNPLKHDYEYQGRNLFLISLAILNYPFKNGLIALGLRLNPKYVDCSQVFIDQTKRTIALLTEGRVELDFPLLNVSKAQTIKYCINNDIPINLTYSCDTGSEIPCKKCPSCYEVEYAYKELENNYQQRV